MSEVLDRLFGKDHRVRGYATGLAAVAEGEGVLDRVGDELFAFSKAAEQNAELRDALTNPALPVENREALVRDILGARAHAMTISQISFLIEAGRTRELSKIAEGVVAIAAERRELAVAEVRSAVPMSDAQRTRMEEALSRATGRKVEVKVVLDPTVVGGVVARVGELVFDGSVATRLEEAKHALGS